MEYKVYKNGQITKFEAGVIYKAVKTEKIKALPETTKTLYNEVDMMLRFADERYNNNHLFYDRIYKITEEILAENFETAQELLNKWESDRIELATK